MEVIELRDGLTEETLYRRFPWIRNCTIQGPLGMCNNKLVWYDKKGEAVMDFSLRNDGWVGGKFSKISLRCTKKNTVQ